MNPLGPVPCRQQQQQHGAVSAGHAAAVLCVTSSNAWSKPKCPKARDCRITGQQSRLSAHRTALHARRLPHTLRRRQPHATYSASALTSAMPVSVT